MATQDRPPSICQEHGHPLQLRVRVSSKCASPVSRTWNEQAKGYRRTPHSLISQCESITLSEDSRMATPPDNASNLDVKDNVQL